MTARAAIRAPSALVTGVAGFIGRHLARSLAADGVEVAGIGPGAWSERERAAWGVAEWHAGDVSAAALRALSRAPDLIFHCAGAGSVGRAEARPDEDERRSVGSAAALVEYVRERAPAARVVFPSSVAVYGSTPGPAREDAPLRPASVYARHKVAAERLLLERGVEARAGVAVVRLASVYGPGLRKQLLWDACGKLSRDDAVFHGTGRELRDWLHVDDAVRLLRLAAERAASRPVVVNGGTGVAASVADVLSEIAAALGRSRSVRFGGVGRAGDPERLLPDVTLARSWGWEARVPWREGVRQYCEWVRAGAP